MGTGLFLDITICNDIVIKTFTAAQIREQLAEKERQKEAKARGKGKGKGRGKGKSNVSTERDPDPQPPKPMVNILTPPN